MRPPLSSKESKRLAGVATPYTRHGRGEGAQRNATGTVSVLPQLQHNFLLSEFMDCPAPSVSTTALTQPSRRHTSPAETAALLSPLQVIALSRSGTSALPWDLQSRHHLLFSALNSGLDTTLSTEEAALFGGATLVCQCSLEAALAVPAGKVPSLATSFPPTRNQLAHMRLVGVLLRTSAGLSVSAAEIAAFTENLRQVSGELPPYVLSSLLAIPSSPLYLGALVDWAVTAGGWGLDARLFSLMMNALLRNDNFFSPASFVAMDAIVVDKVLSRLGSRGGEQCTVGAQVAQFDYISVRWTPLMNKWARVYVRQGQGLALCRCWEHLTAAVPAAENKIPCSFYVRMIGGIIDVCSVTAVETGDDNVRQLHAPVLDAWERVTTVATRCVRLFGRNEEDMHAVWVVLLKAALTLAPADDDWRRLLAAYHLCAAHGHQRPLRADRGAFLQVIRLVSAELGRLSGAENVCAVEEVVTAVCVFVREQDTISFLWLLDGIGSVLERVWETQGILGRRAGQTLLTALQEALHARGTVGVQLAANPALARAMERFGVGEEGGASLFWWRCGCGTELPAAAKRCVTCLRRRPGVSWVCSSCTTEHRSACAVQSCDCGEPNPRLSGAVKAGRSVCASCGEALASAGGAPCPRCHHLGARVSSVVTCPRCGAKNSANALYCSDCYAIPADRPPLSLWHCDNCEELNYSTWSTCRQCHHQRKVGCLRIPFLPWRCRCGSLNHPGRLFCNACSATARSAQEETACFTCRSCEAVAATSGLRSGIDQCALQLTPSVKLSIHRCRRCGTVHPRDQIVLYTTALPHHCMLCSATVRGVGAVSLDGGFYHCGLHQRVNEHFPFQCIHCEYGAELQTGYHCAHCLHPRPEVEAQLAANPGAFFLWRCLQEGSGPDAATCGAWNYSWSSCCRNCGGGRRDSAWECRARACSWECAGCRHHNRPIDVLACASCGRCTQTILECNRCGVPHLSHACHA